MQKSGVEADLVCFSTPSFSALSHRLNTSSLKGLERYFDAK